MRNSRSVLIMEKKPTSSGETKIVGVVRDQAALHGLLARIRNLNLTVISVAKIESNGE